MISETEIKHNTEIELAVSTLIEYKAIFKAMYLNKQEFSTILRDANISMEDINKLLGLSADSALLPVITEEKVTQKEKLNSILSEKSYLKKTILELEAKGIFERIEDEIEATTLPEHPYRVNAKAIKSSKNAEVVAHQNMSFPPNGRGWESFITEGARCAIEFNHIDYKTKISSIKKCHVKVVDVMPKSEELAGDTLYLVVDSQGTKKMIFSYKDDENPVDNEQFEVKIDEIAGLNELISNQNITQLQLSESEIANFIFSKQEQRMEKFLEEKFPGCKLEDLKADAERYNQTFVSAIAHAVGNSREKNGTVALAFRGPESKVGTSYGLDDEGKPYFSVKSEKFIVQLTAGSDIQVKIEVPGKFYNEVRRNGDHYPVKATFSNHLLYQCFMSEKPIFPLCVVKFNNPTETVNDDTYFLFKEENKWQLIFKDKEGHSKNLPLDKIIDSKSKTSLAIMLKGKTQIRYSSREKISEVLIRQHIAPTIALAQKEEDLHQLVRNSNKSTRDKKAMTKKITEFFLSDQKYSESTLRNFIREISNEVKSNTKLNQSSSKARFFAGLNKVANTISKAPRKIQTKFFAVVNNLGNNFRRNSKETNSQKEPGSSSISRTSSFGK